MRWQEVYDDELVLTSIRKRARNHVLVLVGFFVISGTSAATVLSSVWPSPAVALGLILVWSAAGLWAVHRYDRLSRVVWCVKVTATGITGFNYDRRKTRLNWPALDLVEISDIGIELRSGSAGLIVPVDFPDFSTLSHRILELTEPYGIPVFVHGKPWQDLDVYEVFPFLAENRTSSEADSTASA
jgi:hypothetical protein